MSGRPLRSLVAVVLKAVAFRIVRERAARSRGRREAATNELDAGRHDAAGDGTSTTSEPSEAPRDVAPPPADVDAAPPANHSSVAAPTRPRLRGTGLLGPLTLVVDGVDQAISRELATQISVV